MTQKHRYSESDGNILEEYTFCEAKQQIDIGVVILKRGKKLFHASVIGVLNQRILRTRFQHVSVGFVDTPRRFDVPRERTKGTLVHSRHIVSVITIALSFLRRAVRSAQDQIWPAVLVGEVAEREDFEIRKPVGPECPLCEFPQSARPRPHVQLVRLARRPGVDLSRKGVVF